MFKKRLILAGGLIAALVATMSGKLISSRATGGSTMGSDTQVTISYYGSLPSMVNGSAVSYADSGLEKETYTTVSKGIIKNSDGTFYFDAADIHTIASYFNAAESDYEELYSLYQQAVEAAK